MYWPCTQSNGKYLSVINSVDLNNISQRGLDAVHHLLGQTSFPQRFFFPSKHQTKWILLGVITATDGKKPVKPAVKCSDLTKQDIKACRVGCNKVALEDSGRLEG